MVSVTFARPPTAPMNPKMDRVAPQMEATKTSGVLRDMKKAFQNYLW